MAGPPPGLPFAGLIGCPRELYITTYPLGYRPKRSGPMILMVFASPVVPGALYTMPFPLAGTATHPAGILTAVPSGQRRSRPLRLAAELR